MPNSVRLRPGLRPAALALLVVCSLTLASAAETSGVPAKPEGRDAPFQIAPQEAGTVTATVEGERAVVAIKGGRGIGRATIRRNHERWPTTVVVRAYLGGLESLTISGGEAKLSASVSSHSGHSTLLHLWKDGNEGPQLNRDSPYWLEIRRLDAEGKPINGLPPRGGWFELTVPQKLLGEAKEFALHWIDFYR